MDLENKVRLLKKKNYWRDKNKNGKKNKKSC